MLPPDMQIRLLGPLEVVDRDRPIPLGGTKQRALLAVLSLAAGRVVPAGRLVEGLWGVDPPETASKMVQIHVSALRKVLPPAVLVTRSPGYAIDLPRDAVDLFRAEDALRAGREALAAGAPSRARALLTDTLALWRGPALAEFSEPFAEQEGRRLEELRLSLTEERIAADLAMGAHADLVGELEALVAAHGLRERLREQLMLALYRSGRQAEALAAYQDARRALSDELGIEPSARLRELERAVLRQDPGLDAPAPAEAGAGPAAGRGDVPAPVGREAELAALGDLLAEANGGVPRTVLVTGEAGTGKSTLVEAFLAGLDGATLVGHGQCVEQHGPSEAYMPVLQALDRLAGGPGVSVVVPLLVERAPTWVVQMPWLVDGDGLARIQARIVGATRDRMLREAVEALTALAGERTVLIVLEDLHWSDPSTVDLVAALARHRGPARLMVIGTCRPREAATRAHPVHAAAAELVARGLAAEVPARALDEAAVAEYLARRLPGAELPDGLPGVLVSRTGGNPLFVEKAVDSWIEGGRADDAGGVWQLTAGLDELARDVPSTLRQLIRQRLHPLDAGDRRLLEAASVAAPAFSAAAVAAACDQADAEAEERLDELARLGVFITSDGAERWPDGTMAGRFAFTHDLYHEVLYDDLPAGRRARIHLALGDRLERAHGGAARDIAPELATHFVRGGDPARALGHLAAAAEQAARRLAPRETLALSDTALGLLPGLPEDEREEWELRFGVLRGPALIASQGWGSEEAERAFARAGELARRLGRPHEIAWTTYRLATLYEVRGHNARSEELLRAVLADGAPPVGGPLAIDLKELMACTLFHQGDFDSALAIAEGGVAAGGEGDVNPFIAAYGDDPGIACHSWAALSAWHLGREESARSNVDQAIALAGEPGRRHGAATAYALAAVASQCRLDAERTLALAEDAILLAEELGYAYRIAMGRILRGWALAALGRPGEGILELRGGLELSRLTGARMDDAYYLGLLADANLRAGDLAGAGDALREARQVMPREGRFFHDAELHRLQGEVARHAGELESAERSMRTALAVAREQGARTLELRVAVGLGSVLRATGRPTEAHALVAGAYGAFSEGFETADLRAAAAFLAESGGPESPAPPVRYARSGDLSIAYEVSGDGPLDLVLVPGFLSHLEVDRREPRHLRFLERLAGLGRLIRFDKRGTGLSDRPSGVPDLEARMDDLRAVMDAAGSERAVVVGYSEGGPLSLLFAATYPERVSGLVLIGCFAKRLDPDDDYPWAPTRERRRAVIDSLLAEDGLEAMMRSMCPTADEAMARWWGERCRASASPGAIRAHHEMNSLIDVRDVLGAIQAPVLVLHRSGDLRVSVEEGRYIASRIAGAQMIELPGADHFPAIDPDQLIDAAEPFITGIAALAPAAPDHAVATVVVAGGAAGPLVSVYDGPSRAVRAALALAARLGRGVGVHTGPVPRGSGRPEGEVVAIATEVAAHAAVGEVLVTTTTRDLVPGSGLAFADRGERSLGGNAPRRLFAAVASEDPGPRAEAVGPPALA